MFVSFVLSAQREKDIAVDEEAKRAAARLDFKYSLLLRLFQCMCESTLVYTIRSDLRTETDDQKTDLGLFKQRSFSFAVCCRSSADFPLRWALDPCLHSPPSKTARPHQTTARIVIEPLSNYPKDKLADGGNYRKISVDSCTCAGQLQFHLAIIPT